MEKYSHYVAVKKRDNYYGIAVSFAKEKFEQFYNHLKTFETHCTVDNMSKFATEYGTSDWTKISNSEMVQKIAKENNYDMIYSVVGKEKSIFEK